jgi:hypothetical protein
MEYLYPDVGEYPIRKGGDESNHKHINSGLTHNKNYVKGI